MLMMLEGQGQKKMLISVEPGLKKLKFPPEIATFPIISYVFLHLKLKNFPPNDNISQNQVAKLPFFLPVEEVPTLLVSV